MSFFRPHYGESYRKPQFGPTTTAGLGNLALANRLTFSEQMQQAGQVDPSVFLTQSVGEAIARRHDKDYKGTLSETFRALPDGTRLRVRPVAGHFLAFRSSGVLSGAGDIGSEGYCKVITGNTKLVGMGDGENTTAIISPCINRYEEEPYLLFKTGYLEKKQECQVSLDVDPTGNPLFVIEVELPEAA